MRITITGRARHGLGKQSWCCRCPFPATARLSCGCRGAAVAGPEGEAGPNTSRARGGSGREAGAGVAERHRRLPVAGARARAARQKLLQPEGRGRSVLVRCTGPPQAWVQRPGNSEMAEPPGSAGSAGYRRGRCARPL